MEYSAVIKEINNVCCDSFNMNSFNQMGIINSKINQIASMQDMKDQKKEYNYRTVKSYFDETLFIVLKDKLGYEDEVIKKIMNYISFAEIIEEIFVVDGNIIVKAVNKSFDGKYSRTYYIPEDGFYDIA